MGIVDYVEAAVVVEAVRRQNLDEAYVTEERILDMIVELVEINISMEIRVKVLDNLIDKGSVSIVRDGLAGDFYKFVKSEFINEFNRNAKNEKSLISKYTAIGSQFLHRAISNSDQHQPVGERLPLEQPVDQAPASDRLVALSDNSSVRDEIVGKLDDLATAIGGDNDEFGKLSERERIVAEIRSGQELLKAPSVRVKAVWTVLGGVLSWLALEFSGGLIGELAGLLLEALKPLLGIA